MVTFYSELIKTCLLNFEQIGIFIYWLCSIYVSKFSCDINTDSVLSRQWVALSAVRTLSVRQSRACSMRFASHTHFCLPFTRTLINCIKKETSFANHLQILIESTIREISCEIMRNAHMKLRNNCCTFKLT